VRTAYKVWSGIAAGVFCLVAIVDLSSNHTNGTPTAATAASSPPVTVRSVDGWAAMTLSNGDRVYDTNEGSSEDACQLAYMAERARPAIVGRQVTRLTQTSSSPFGTAPAGYAYAYISLSDGTNPDAPMWRDARDQYAGEAVTYCQAQEEATETTSATPEPEAAPETTTSSGDSTHVYVDHHHNLPDGALTGGYCARKWWC
jgi:hypothetical protein